MKANVRHVAALLAACALVVVDSYTLKMCMYSDNKCTSPIDACENNICLTKDNVSPAGLGSLVYKGETLDVTYKFYHSDNKQCIHLEMSNIGGNDNCEQFRGVLGTHVQNLVNSIVNDGRDVDAFCASDASIFVLFMEATTGNCFRGTEILQDAVSDDFDAYMQVEGGRAECDGEAVAPPICPRAELSASKGASNGQGANANTNAGSDDDDSSGAVVGGVVGGIAGVAVIGGLIYYVVYARISKSTQGLQSTQNLL